MFVVDTNVAISANGRETHADDNCRLACVRELRLMAEEGIIAIDDGFRILREYTKLLTPSGMPGPGDMFVKHVLAHQYCEDRVRRVPLTRSDDDRRGFEELPRNTFDRSDRKFLAVAVAASAVVLNATDSDWREHAALMKKLQVKVRQLCPQHARKTPRRRR